ncbi:MAG: IS66 family transposase [Pseudonocardiaceae bacterium]
MTQIIVIEWIRAEVHHGGPGHQLMRSMLGVAVSVGFMAGVRGRAARVLEATLVPPVRELLRQAGVLHVDETPGRAAGGLQYVHVAASEFLTVMHTGGRSKADIDAGQVLPGLRRHDRARRLRRVRPPHRHPSRLVLSPPDS